MSVARPRLCVVTPVHWKAFMGGAQYQIKCLLDYLRTLDRYDIHYVARRVPDDTELDGYSIRHIGDGRQCRESALSPTPRTCIAHCGALQPDVIYQRVGCAYTGIAAHFARRNGCGLVWHAANDTDVQPGLKVAERNFVRRRLERSLLSYGIRRADRTITQTEHQARLLFENFGRRPDAVIANFHPLPDGNARA